MIQPSIGIMLHMISKMIPKHDSLRYTNLSPTWFESRCCIQSNRSIQNIYMLRTQQIIVYHARKDLPIIKAKHENILLRKVKLT